MKAEEDMTKNTSKGTKIKLREKCFPFPFFPLHWGEI